MSNPVLESRFLPLTRLVRRRLLPSTGEVLVHVGDVVQAQDVVARGALEGQLCAIDLVDALGVSVQAAERHVMVEEGQHVAVGTLLAQKKRLWLRSKQVRAPFSGSVQALIEGRLFLRQEPQPFLLQAHIPGEVVEHYPQRGAAICTTGAWVRGVWGCGTEQRGVLAVVVGDPGAMLTWEHVGLRYRGTILVAGMLSDPRALFRARQFGIGGLVLGSILPDLRSLCERLGLVVLVTEGLGSIPMATPVFELLHSHHGHMASLIGGEQAPKKGARTDYNISSYDSAELVIPLQLGAASKSLSLMRPIAVGLRVRITRAPYLGIIGQVASLPAIPQQTAAGSQAEGAEVRLPDGHRVFIPTANMELLG
jgi:hypothetical protein